MVTRAGSSMEQEGLRIESGRPWCARILDLLHRWSGVTQQPTERALLFAVLALSLLLRAVLALTDHGTNWPDEHFQTLEPAHHLAFGYGKLAWEQVYGARFLLFPWLLAGIMKAAALVSAEPAAVYLGAIRLLMVAVSLLGIYGTYRLAKSLGSSGRLAVLAAALWGLCPAGIYFAHRATPENVGTALVLFGLALVFEGRGGTSRLLLGTGLLTLAAMLRLQMGLFCLVPLVVALSEKKGSRLVGVAVVGATGLLLLGGLDWLWWGQWFHSTRQYLAFNVGQGGANQFGTEPAHYYLAHLLTAGGPAFWLAVPFVFLARGRARWALGLALAFLLAHSALAHKELRFVLVAWPLLGVAAVSGLERLSESARYVGAGGLVVLTAAAGPSFRWLSNDDVGSLIAGDDATPGSALDYYGSVNRLTMRAAREPSLCGLVRLGIPEVRTTGYAHLHREVPFEARSFRDQTPRGEFNYIITKKTNGYPGEVIAVDGLYHLLWNRKEICEYATPNHILPLDDVNLSIPARSPFTGVEEQLRASQDRALLLPKKDEDLSE